MLRGGEPNKHGEIKESVTLGKYMYLCYVRWKDKAFELGSDYFTGTWMPKHDELCKKHGVKLLKWGTPYGTVETNVYVYDTDLELAKYQEFRSAVARIMQGLIDYTKTTIVNCPHG